MKKQLLLTECDFKAVRSSGPGGQHVNKTSSKVMVFWDLESSAAVSEDEKIRLREKLVTRLTKEGVLVLSCDSGRSQHKNKDEVIKNLINMLKNGLQRPKIRRKTKPSRSSKLKRLQHKKRRSEKKSNRKPPDY